MRFARIQNPMRPSGLAGVSHTFRGWLILAVGMGLAQPAIGESWLLGVRIEPEASGRIDGLPDAGSCDSDCSVRVQDPVLAGFLAEPNRGYRFSHWEGACESTIGPLCTLPISGDADVVAHFTPEAESTQKLQGVLLLHGEGESPAVWNKVVDRQFSGRCPTLYGGVPLGRAPEVKPNTLQCYRLRFGYHAALEGADSMVGTTTQVSQWQTEIRAAVAGLMDSHPDQRLVLVGRNRALAAAKRFLKTSSPERRAVYGLLEVAAPGSSAAVTRSSAGLITDEQEVVARARESLRSR